MSHVVAPAEGQLLGDLDDDGNPSVGDAIKILRIVVGLDLDDPCADANQSGGTDVGDAIKVLRCVVGLDVWPIGPCEESETVSAVMARLTDPNGSPLANVTMSLAGTTSVSDGQGHLRLDGISPTTGALANFALDGYVSTARRVDVIAGEQVTFDVTMVPVGRTETIDTTAESEVLHAGGGIRIPAGAVVDAAGSPVSTAQVQVTTARPTDTGYTSFFPGPFIGRQASDGTEGLLLSYGFVDVTLEDAAGNPLQLAQGQSAEMIFPIDPGIDPGSGTVPLWYYDAAQGVWVEEGAATRDAGGGVYRGSVAHLTPWNIDFWAVPAFKRVTVLDGDGNPVVGAWVTVAPATGGAWWSVDVTDSNGQVTVPVRPNSGIRVWAQKGRVVTSPVMDTSPGVGETLDNTITIDPAQATMTLTWGANPRDLDLHLTVPTTPDRSHIYKASQGSLSQPPYAGLDNDVTTGFGPEVISARRLLPGTYRCAVHNYSGQTQTTGICNSNAVVVLGMPDEVDLQFFPPAHNTNHMNNDVWLVFDLVVTESGSVTVNPLNAWGATGDFHPAE